MAGGEPEALDRPLVLQFVDGYGEALVKQFLGLLGPEVDEEVPQCALEGAAEGVARDVAVCLGFEELELLGDYL